MYAKILVAGLNNVAESELCQTWHTNITSQQEHPLHRRNYTSKQHIKMALAYFNEDFWPLQNNGVEIRAVVQNIHQTFACSSVCVQPRSSLMTASAFSKGRIIIPTCT